MAWLGMNPELSLSLGDMSTEFDEIIDRSWATWAQLSKFNTETWGMGKSDRWDFDQTPGLLIFTFADGAKVTCDAQIIGSYNYSNKSWVWAWANSSWLPALCNDSNTVGEYGEKNDLTMLTTSRWTADEEWAWAMTAIAVELTGAEGCYRGPSGDLGVFMTFRNVVRQVPQ